MSVPSEIHCHRVVVFGEVWGNPKPIAGVPCATVEQDDRRPAVNRAAKVDSSNGMATHIDDSFG